MSSWRTSRCSRRSGLSSGARAWTPSKGRANGGQQASTRKEKEQEAMMKNLDRIRKQLTPVRSRKIAARAATLIAEEKSLQELRQAHKLTQKRMAEVLGVGQDSVSRLEQRSDLLISTLRGYVEAMGGRLSLVAEFPNQEPVVLTGIAALDAASPGARD